MRTMPDSGLSVLHVLPTFNPRYGGPVAVAAGMCRALAEHGVGTTMVSGEGRGGADGILSEQSDRDNGGRWGYSISARLYSTIRNLVRDSDVVHIHGLWNFPATTAARCCRKVGIPYILTPHGMLTPWSLSQSRFKKAFYLPVERGNVRGAAVIHFFTVEESERSELWECPADVLILPNGVPRVHHDRQRDREKLERLFPTLRGKVVLLFLGRLHPGKGLDLLLPAFSRLWSKNAECALAICGPDAEYGAEVRRMVEDLGISDSVLRTGLVVGETKHALLGGADLFVLPSRHEGDSVAIKEAMQAGLPVVFTPGCGFPDAVDAGAAIVVEPEVGALFRGMERLAADQVLREDMGCRGRALVNSTYLWDQIAPRFRDAYLELASRQGKGR